MSIPYGVGSSSSKTKPLPPSFFRTADNPRQGVWEHRGKVAVVGLGHSPTARRWDGDPETSLGAWTLLAIQKALDDAGLSAEQVDGMVVVPDCSTGSFWPDDEPIPADFLARFQHTDDLTDGLAIGVFLGFLDILANAFGKYLFQGRILG